MDGNFDWKRKLLMSLSPNVRRAWNHREEGLRLRSRIIFDYELLYLEKGELTIRIEDTVHKIVPGEMVLFKPGVEHEFLGSDGECWMPHIHFDLMNEEDFDEVPVHFKPRSECTSVELAWLRGDILGNQLRLPDVIRIENHGEALKTLHQLIHAYERPDLEYFLMQKALVLQLLYYIVKGLETSENPRLLAHRKSLDAAATCIMERFDQTLPLEELAKIATLSVFHFSRLFKQRYGITPHQYQLRYRIERAKELMAYTPLSMTAIAEKVGYGSLFAFSKAFKQSTGLSPRRFLQTHGGEAER